MATHSSILAWRIPWTEEPGGLQSTGVARVGHDLATKPLPLLLLGGKVETEAGRAESGSAIPGPRGEYFPLSCPLSPEDTKAELLPHPSLVLRSQEVLL